MLSVIIQDVIMLIVVMMNVPKLGEIKLKKTSHNREKVTHCVVMQSAVVLSVVAPCLVLAYALTQ
jgi:hypothetical protein